MTFKATLGCGLTIGLLGTTLLAWAAKSTINPLADPPPTELMIQDDTNIFVPDTPIQIANRDFTLDWNDDISIAANKDKVAAIEILLSKPVDYKKMRRVEKQALGELLYKLGTYYTHIAREPDLAIDKLDLADKLLINKEERGWNNAHLAYAYEQKYRLTQDAADKKEALSYVKDVIIPLLRTPNYKQVAFAYSVQGLVQNDAKDYAGAEASFKEALSIYEDIPDGEDDQYIRAKNKLATIILKRPSRNQEAMAMLEEVKAYWLAKSNIHYSPYAAKNFTALCAAYLKSGNAKEARDECNRAIAIYNNVYGANSTLLAKPYLLLSAAYLQLGNQEQVKIYREKMSLLSTTADVTIAELPPITLTSGV